MFQEIHSDTAPSQDTKKRFAVATDSYKTEVSFSAATASTVAPLLGGELLLASGPLCAVRVRILFKTDISPVAFVCLDPT